MYLARVKKYLKWLKRVDADFDQYSVMEFANTNFKSSSTKNQVLAALKLFLKENDKIVQNIGALPQISKPRTHLDDVDQDKLLRARLGNFYDVRNQIIIRLMMRCGMRISEALGLNLNDINFRDRSIRIMGEQVKRKKPRITYMDTDTKKLIQFYVKRDNIGAKQRLFYIDPPAFRYAFKKYTAAAGLGKDLSPHSLRHTFAINYMQKGGELTKLKKFLGHKDVNTTSIYLNYTDEELRKDYDKVHK